MHLVVGACVWVLFIIHVCRGQEHLGCFADSTAVRLLPTFGENSNSNNVDTCIDICKSKGKTYAGVGLASECWCGDVHNLSRHGVVTESESDGTWCNYRCSGNQSQICGGVDRINVYSVCPRERYRDPGGSTGNCDNECHCNASHICVYSTGQCPGGCQDGWHGTSCSLNVLLTTPSSGTTAMGSSTIDTILSLETTAVNIMTSPTPTITRAATQVAGIAAGTTVALLAVLVIIVMALVYFCRHRSRRRNSSSHIQPLGPTETTIQDVDGSVHQAIIADTCVDTYDTKSSSGANGEDTGDTTGAVYYNTKAVTGAGRSDGYANSQPKGRLVDTGVYEDPHGYMNMSTEPTYTPLNQSAVYQNIQ